MEYVKEGRANKWYGIQTGNPGVLIALGSFTIIFRYCPHYLLQHFAKMKGNDRLSMMKVQHEQE